MNVDVVRQRLATGDPETVLKELVDLYRRAEVLHTPQLPRILEGLFPVWQSLLESTLAPQATATSTHRARKVLLQILHRLPSNDALRPFVGALLRVLMDVLRRDNEENALVALKTLFDLHRNYRPGLRGEVPAFLEVVQQMYRNVPLTMGKQFAPVKPPTPPTSIPISSTPPTGPATAATAPTTAVSGVATEAPAGAATTVIPTTATATTTPPTVNAVTSSTTSTTAPAPIAVVTAAASPMNASASTSLESTAGTTVDPGALSGSVESKGETAATPAATESAGGGTDVQKEVEQSKDGANNVAAQPPTPEDLLWSAMDSFKAISELPLIIMLLFQCYPNYIETHVPVLVPLMMQLLAQKVPEATARAHPTRYADFLDCQVKTLSFVTYLLRGCAHLLRPFQDAICEHTVKLLTVCPKDAFVLRKDIFVAARHIISTEFRRGFYPQLETLLDDDVLIGKGRCSYHQIRPLAYSTLADMIHHVRDMLTLPQVSAIIDFYGKRIHDATLPISIQTTSIRLLLNLVDISAKNDDPDGWKGRNILGRILLIISTKFGTTLTSLPTALALTHQNQSKSHPGPSMGVSDRSDLLDGGALEKIQQSSLLPVEPVEKSPVEKKLEVLFAPHLRLHRGPDAFVEEEPCLRDVKSLLRTMILGVRAVIWCTANYRNPHAKDITSMDACGPADGLVAPGNPSGYHSTDNGVLRSGSTEANPSTSNSSSHVYPLTDDERKLIAKVLQNGLRCFILYTLSENTLAEEKQMLDHFAGAFTVLDAPDFRDLFLANMQLLYACILQDHAILTIPQHFLANSNVSCWFAEILLKFLITQMKDLSVSADVDSPDISREAKLLEIENLRFERMRPVPQSHRASIVLRLFKIVFGSVTLFKSNESALFPHLRTIIESCLKEATYTRHPDNYLLLLRALFRSISGGKYENFYKEIFPLLPGILSALMRLQKHLHKPTMQEVLLELCLTIPARLSSLLQYLPSLMKSVVRAILCRGELAYLGLRTLEFWVDNLNPDFLYPIMTSQERLLTEIIEALNTHLLPPPYPYGELAMRILGKIGGRNRQYLMDPLNLPFEEPTRDGLVIEFAWESGVAGGTVKNEHDPDCPTLSLKMDVVIRSSTKILQRYLRRTEHEWDQIVKTDTRLVESDEYDEHSGPGSDAVGGPVTSFGSPPLGSASQLFEKDDQTLGLERQSVVTVKNAILRYKRQAFEVIANAAVVAMRLNLEVSVTESEDGEDIWMMDDVHAPTASTSRIAEWECELETRSMLLRSLFATVEDVDFGNEALELLTAVAARITISALARCQRRKPNFAALSTLQPSSLLPGNRGLSPGRHLATAKRIEVLREAAYGIPFVSDCCDAASELLALASSILEALSSPVSAVVDGGKSVLKHIVSRAISGRGDKQSAVYQAGGVLNTVGNVFAHACYDKSSWRTKLGGVLGLRILVDNLEPVWCHENELVIVKALFFVLSDHPTEVSALVSGETGETLLRAVRRAREVRGVEISKWTDGIIKSEDFSACMAFQETEIFQMFVVEFLSPRAPARKYAKECIATVAKFAETTESAMLFPYQQLISKQITGSNLRSLPMTTRTGYIDAMAHALSLKPSIFPLTKELLSFLLDVWRLISDEVARTESDGNPAIVNGSSSGISPPTPQANQANSTTSPVSAQEYPFGLSHASEIRIAAVRLFRAAFLAAPEEMNQHQDVRNRIVGVFFRFLTRQPEELVMCAQHALTDVIHLNKQHKEITLPKELLQQCLRPVLLNLADYRKLNLPLLDGLARLLTLLSTCFNVTLGEKLLEHLKQWRDPERIIKAGIWKRGEEPAVAAAIVDLFHLLPPNDSFLDALVACIVELEAVLPKYGSNGKMSSPYRLPLVRFLNRYASSAVTFFLKKEHLLDQRFSSLFEELLKMPDAAPLRAIIISDSGTEQFVSATFIAGAKLASSTPTLIDPGLKPMDTSAASSEDVKMQAQIQLNAQKAAAQAVANAQAQGLSITEAEARGFQARAAYIAKAQAQVNAQQALKVQSQVQIQANAQKLHAQTLAAAQAQGLSLVQAQAKAQFASKDYIAKAQSQVAVSTALPSPLSASLVTTPTGAASALASQQQAQLHAQIQVNAQKVHAQALAAAQAQGLKPIQAQEKAKQAQATYVHRAKAQAQAKIARAQSQGSLASAIVALPPATSTGVAVALTPFSATPKAHQDALELQYQGLILLRSICKIHPSWLTSSTIIDNLRKLWRSPARAQRLASQERLPIRYHSESKMLVKLLVSYARAQPEDVQVLIDLLPAFGQRSAFDLSFLQRYFHDEVAQRYSPIQKRNIVRLFLRILREPATSEELKVHAVQWLIMPMLTASFEDPNVSNVSILDPDTVQWMLREILATKDSPPDTMPTLRIELLQLGTLLIQHMSKYVTEHRKDVIKFAWNHLKAPDLTSKLWAYVNVCRFISVYDTPPKIVLQVYVALLRTHELDARFLVRRAFDILLPALPVRLPSNEFIKAIKWTKKIAYEEGHVLGQLVHIWFLIVRHPALFYPFRGQFVPLMVNSLNRLAIPPSSTPDNRRLAVNIVDLIIAWEQTRQDRMFQATTSITRSGKKRPGANDMSTTDSMDELKHAEHILSPDEKRRKVVTLEGEVKIAATDSGPGADTEPTAKSTVNEDDFELSPAMVDLVINFVFRFALASADKQETSRLSKTCGGLFDKALKLWPSATIRFSYFDKLIAVTAEAVIRQQQSLTKPVGPTTPPAAAQVQLTSGSPGSVPVVSTGDTDASSKEEDTPTATANMPNAGSSSVVPSMPSFISVPKGAPLSSLAILDAVLGILNSLVQPAVVSHSTRSIPYVIQYAPRVMKLLEPCFDRQNQEIQASLSSFLRRMVELYPPHRAPQQLSACKFYPWLKEIIHERLQNACALQQELVAALPSSTGALPHKVKSKASGSVTASNSKMEPKSTSAGATSSATTGPANTASGAASNTASAPKRQKVVGSAGSNQPVIAESTKAKLLAAQNARGLSPSLFAGESVLRMLASIAEALPDFAEQFVPSLLKLAQFFAREHVLQSTAMAQGGRGSHIAIGDLSTTGCVGETSSKHRVMATPSLAITEEWKLMQCGRSVLSMNNVVRHMKKKDEKHRKKLQVSHDGGITASKDPHNFSSNGGSSTNKGPQAASVPGTAGSNKKKAGQASSAQGSVGVGASTLITHKLAVELLILCLVLVSKCTFSSGDHRRLYTNLLVHCIESSTNIPLLLQITKIVGDAVTTTDPRHVLTAKDKMTLLTKLTTFDRLHEVAALPLTEAYYDLVLKLCNASDVKHSYFHISPTSQSHSLTAHFLMGLLAPEPNVRERFLKHFFSAAPSIPPSPIARLQLVLRQDWQSCGARYWPTIAVETLLSAASREVAPRLRTTSPQQAPILNSESSNFVTPEKYRDVQAESILRPLRSLAHIDLDLAEELWVHVFGSVWSQLGPSGQTQVASSMLKVLSSKFNKRDLNVPLSRTPRRVNVVQTLLKSMVSVAPTAPVLTPELVVHLASAYDVWSSAARICEHHVELASLSAECRLRWIEALSTIYRGLEEDDLRVGLSLEHGSQPETRAALVLEALGCVHEAQEEYFKALSKAQSGRVSMEDVNLFELRLWEERWVGCAKQLCQWQLMHDFAKATQNQELLLDCAWKRGDWHGAKQLLGSPALQTAAGEPGCPQTRLQRLYIAILDGDKRSAIENLAAQTAELALTQWQGLPRVLSRSHIGLLHLFHQFVEVKESMQMMSDIKHASQLHTLPNLKPSINTWRERLPNKWEPILMWDDILTWRSHMFSVVKNTFSWSDAQMLACMHDSPWSVLRLAHTARKQHLPDVCLGALSKLYSIPAMDVQDAFAKLREQVSICYESSTEYHGGLSILNNTNLDYFSLRQKAEMFRLKALFLEAMGQSDEANQTFSHCLQICDSYGKGWLSWGNYCYRLFLERKDLAFASQTIACYLQAIHHRCNAARLMIARVLWLLSLDDPSSGQLVQAFETHGKQLPIWIWIVWIPQLLMALARPEAPQIRGLLRGLSAKFPQALYYTMRAFFLESRDTAMLTGNDQSASRTGPSAPPTTNNFGSSGPLTPPFGSASGSAMTSPSTSTVSTTSASSSMIYYRTKTGQVVAIPTSMPIVQVQQIPGLLAPGRPSPAAFGVPLNSVLSLEGWRERLNGSTATNSASSDFPKPEVGPVQYTEDLLNFLRRTHDTLTFEMECVLEEMITKFRPEPEEELLTAVHSLLLKCYQLPRLSSIEVVPRMLRAALDKVCHKLFVVVPNQKNDKHVAFVDEFKTAFEEDFARPAGYSDDETVSLFEMMDRLKKWRNLLQRRVQQDGRRGVGRLRLEHCSRFLMELSSANMEVPGQYIADSEPIKDLHARILYFDNDVDVLLRSGYSQRRLAMGGSDGRTYCFLVQYAMTHTTRTDERMAQMYLLLNRLLWRHKETKKRNAVFHVPKIIPLTPRVRLLEDHRDFVTLGEIYDQECRATDRDPDFPIEHYRQRISEAYANMTGDSQQEDEQLAMAKARAFEEICEEHVPETLLARYVYNISSHADSYFQFRGEFTKHLALSSFLSYGLFVGDRAPHRVLFSRRTARVVSAELRPGYATSGILEASSSMPFRLTRNLHNFITRPGVHGPFSVVMAATAEALMSEEDLFGNQLSLFFRDDLLSWHASKTRLTALESPSSGQSHAQRQRRLESQVQQRVDANVSLVMERVRGISLKKESESQRGKSVRALLEIATSPERQRDMYPTWCPWL